MDGPVTETDTIKLSPEEIFHRKYISLRRRCEQIQQANEKLVNRLHHVKKMIRKYKKERKFLMTRLDDHGDGYRDTAVPYVWEESQIYSMLGAPPGGSGAGFAGPTPGSLSIDTSVGMLGSVPGMPPITPPKTMPSMAAEGSGFTSPTSTPKPAKKAKSDKPEKDPNAPKKPANAFFMFCQQQRPLVQEAYLKENEEEISHQELTKRLALKWNGLEQDKKKVYYDLYEKEKEKYEKELKQYIGRETKGSTSVSAETGPTSTAESQMVKKETPS